ncbi:MAG TPA: tetratricopeptide repeat protein, partial [Acidimicrobiales bacterium]
MPRPAPVVAVRPPAPAPSRGRAARCAAERAGLAGWVLVVAAGLAWGWLAVADAGVSLRAAPLMGRWRWQSGPALLPAIGLAVAVAARGPRLAARLPWRRLPWSAGAAATARALALAAAGLVAFALEPVAQTLDDAAATVPSDLTLPDALAALDTLEAQGKWSEAIEPATRIADAVAEQSGADSLGYAEALTRLAEVQRRAGDPAKAEFGFARAISIIEARTGGLSGRLIDPLRGLGFSYADMQDHARAAIVLERAVLTLRRNRGLFDPSQLEVLERLAASQTANREFADAEQTLRYSVRVAEQSYGARDPRVAGPMSRLADWYSSVFAYDVARNFYRT